MTLLKNFLLVGLITLTNCATSNSQPSTKWKLIGEKVANFKLDRDVLLVNSNQTFNQIKVRVLNSKVLMEDMQVEFGNGEVVDVPLREVFGADGYSRVIDLPRNNRHITRITFLYKTALKSIEKATIQVWGRR
jgi:hypothetical protein